MVIPAAKHSNVTYVKAEIRTFKMTFPGFDGDIKLLADIAAIDAKRNTQGEERALDLIASYEHIRRKMAFKTGEKVFPEDEAVEDDVE
jgi:hypothetical protein